jgi:outer membrane lipoprotein SlyB
MFIRPLTTVLCVTAVSVLSACVVAPPREERVVYTQSAPVMAEYGRVDRIGYIQIAQRPSGAGVVLGAVLGAVVGNQFGAGTGRALATGAGAVGGAVIGNNIEGRTLRDDEVYRVTVRFDNGVLRDFDFRRIDDLRTGDRVKFEGGQLHRL